MSPSDLKRLNVERFERLLLRESDRDKRAMLERLLAEEKAKDESDYPTEQGSTSGRF